MKFGSLFAGIGGIDLGLERAGMECVWQVEIDDYCTRVLEKHWPNVKRYSDVRECGKQNLQSVDLIAGGFPCQPHSVAGKQRGAEDDRNLWPEYRRIIKALKPRYVLAENVPGITTTYLDIVLSDLESEGYTRATFNIPAIALDAPHRRERIFIVAYSSRGRRESRGDGEEKRPISIADQSSDVAHADRTRQLQSQGLEPEKRGRSGDSGQALADAEEKRQQGKRQEGHQITERHGEAQVSIQNSGNRTVWTVEPDVGRVVARLPSRLDDSVNAHKSCIKKARTAGVPHIASMSELWERGDGPETSSESSRCTLCGVPLSEVPHHETPEQWDLGTWIKEAEGVRYMRTGVHELYTYESENLQPSMSVGTWSHQCLQTMENRVDRLRGLGNAVVPQVAEWIGRRIIEFDDR